MVQQLYAVERRPSLLKAILWAGLAAGTLDALFAIVDFTITTHLNPVRIFWFIASGAFGPASSSKVLLTADTSTQFMYAAAGVLFHYFIAYSFVTLLFFVYPVLKKVFKNIIVIAIVYGVFAWLVMNYIVVPMAFNGRMPKYTLTTVLDVLYLVIAIGLIGSVFADKYYTRKG